jgi:hypothetical protein
VALPRSQREGKRRTECRLFFRIYHLGIGTTQESIIKIVNIILKIRYLLLRVLIIKFTKMSSTSFTTRELLYDSRSTHNCSSPHFLFGNLTVFLVPDVRDIDQIWCSDRNRCLWSPGAMYLKGVSREINTHIYDRGNHIKEHYLHLKFRNRIICKIFMIQSYWAINGGDDFASSFKGTVS